MIGLHMIGARIGEQAGEAQLLKMQQLLAQLLHVLQHSTNYKVEASTTLWLLL